MSVNLPCEKKSRRAGRSLGCKNSMGDGGHPCSTPTTDLWRKMSTWNTLNYLFKCLETIFRQWHINQTLPEPGMVVYINAVHLGERSQQTLHLLFCGEMAEKRKTEVHRKNLKILLFFFLSPLLYSPFFFFFSSFFKSQRECVGELVVCTKMKSRGHPFEILLKSKLPFHFNSSQETESGATANCFGHIVIYCV